MASINYKILVINLDRSPQRLKQISERLKQFDLTFERIEAFDGKTLSDEFIQEVSPAKLVAKNYHRALSKGEVGCALSHKAAWQKVIDDKLDFAIILEDDIFLKDSFKDLVNFLTKLPTSGWDYIKLFPLTRPSEKNIDQLSTVDQFEWVTYHKFPLGMQGQVISFQGAQSLVKHMPFILKPVDAHLKSWWELSIQPYGLRPYCIEIDPEGVSDINPNSELEQRKQNALVKKLNKLKTGWGKVTNQEKLNRSFHRFMENINKSG